MAKIPDCIVKVERGYDSTMRVTLRWFAPLVCLFVAMVEYLERRPRARALRKLKQARADAQDARAEAARLRAALLVAEMRAEAAEKWTH
jgi:hypothetical protein